MSNQPFTDRETKKGSENRARLAFVSCHAKKIRQPVETKARASSIWEVESASSLPKSIRKGGGLRPPPFLMGVREGRGRVDHIIISKMFGLLSPSALRCSTLFAGCRNTLAQGCAQHLVFIAIFVEYIPRRGAEVPPFRQVSSPTAGADAVDGHVGVSLPGAHTK